MDPEIKKCATVEEQIPARKQGKHIPLNGVGDRER